MTRSHRGRRGSVVVIVLLVTALLSLLGLSYLLSSNLKSRLGRAGDRVRLVSAAERGLLSVIEESRRTRGTGRALELARGAAPGIWLSETDAQGTSVQVLVRSATVSPRPPRGWDLSSANQRGFATVRLQLHVRASARAGGVETLDAELRVPVPVEMLGGAGVR